MAIECTATYKRCFSESVVSHAYSLSPSLFLSLSLSLSLNTYIYIYIYMYIYVCVCVCVSLIYILKKKKHVNLQNVHITHHPHMTATLQCENKLFAAKLSVVSEYFSVFFFIVRRDM